VNNDAGDSYDSAGSIKKDEIHNNTFCSASSKEVSNTDNSTNEAVADLSSIIETKC
jgi:hypothetical protein